MKAGSMHDGEITDLQIHLGTIVTPYTDHDEPQQWGGEATLVPGDAESGPIVGNVEAFLIDPERWSFYEACDSLSGSTEAVAAEVCGEGGELDRKLFDDNLNIWMPVLLLDTIHVAPEYRGRGFGPAIAAMTIHALGIGSDLVLCYPAPMGDPENDKTREEAIAALGRTWAKVGFTQLHRDGKPLGTWFVSPRDVDPVMSLAAR